MLLWEILASQRLRKNSNSVLTFGGGLKVKAKALADVVSGELTPLVHGGFFFLCFQLVNMVRGLQGLVYKATNPTHEVSTLTT